MQKYYAGTIEQTILVSQIGEGLRPLEQEDPLSCLLGDQLFDLTRVSSHL